MHVQEPDTYNIKWEQTSVPGLQSVYLNLLPVLFKINQGVPFMVQGTGQAALVNWGDGFVTDASTISSLSLSDPNGFFEGIMTAPYLRQVNIIIGYAAPGPASVEPCLASPAALSAPLPLSCALPGPALPCLAPPCPAPVDYYLLVPVFMAQG